MIVFEWVILCLLVIKFIAADDSISEEHKLAEESSAEGNESVGLGHGFYRDMNMLSEHYGTRRVYGGTAVELQEFPAVCALTDRHLSVRCSGTLVTRRWALTAAHCVSPHLSYVKYNTRRPHAAAGGNIATVDMLYIHPSYHVRQVQRSEGQDVTDLYHDVGLVRTAEDMAPAAPPTSLGTLRAYNSFELFDKEVLVRIDSNIVSQVLGFGRTEQSVQGDELFGVQLRLSGCGRRNWVHCVCGHGGPDSRGVCSGDSGGPVVYNGVLVGVTSMGPLECVRVADAPPLGLTSVFTSIYQYADRINSTVHGDAHAMRRISAAPSRHTAELLAVAVVLSLVCLVL